MKRLRCLQASGKEANGKDRINCFGVLSQNMSYNGHVLGQWAASRRSFCCCSNAFNQHLHSKSHPVRFPLALEVVESGYDLNISDPVYNCI